MNNIINFNKADDVTRRKFIQRCSYFLGIFGLPYLARVETVEKIAKRIFGGWNAYAQGASKQLYWLNIGARSGLHNFPCGAVAEDAIASAGNAPERNYFEGQAVLAANAIAAGTTGGNALYPSSPFAAFAAANPTRIVAVNMLNNGNGHTGMPVSWVNGSNCASTHSYAMKKYGFSYTTSPVVFGSRNSWDSTAIGGSVGPGDIAQYFNDADGARSLVSLFKLTSNGNEFAQSSTNQVLEVINNANENIIDILKNTKRDGAVVEEGMQSLNDLLKIDQSALLAPEQVAIDAYNLNLNNPNNFSLTTDVGEALDFFEKMIINNFSPNLTLVLRTGDWHGRPANMGTDVNNTGAGTLQQQHAQEISTIIENLYGRLNTIADPNNAGDMLGDNTCFTICTEFHRGRFNPNEGNNTDGDSNGFFGIFPDGYVRAGSYGDRAPGTGSGNRLPPDPSDPNGGTTTSSVGAAAVTHTLLSSMGIGKTERDEAGMSGGELISAIPQQAD